MSEDRELLERLIEVRRWREARHLLARSLAKDPDDPSLHCQAARVALGEGDPAAADEHIRRALGLSPLHFQARALRLQRLLDDERWSDAEAAVIELIRERPDDADLLATYAHVMLLGLNLEKARGLVEAALRREPANPSARRLDVLLATVEGRSARAREELASLLADDPEGEAVARTLLVVLLDQNQHREAERVAQALLRADPADEGMIEVVVALRARNHWLAWPSSPILRFGWLGSGGLWLFAVLALFVLRRVAPDLVLPLAAAWILYVVYTWAVPPLLRRWIAHRGLR